MMMRLQQMPSDAKEVLHQSMHGQESLRLPRSFKLRIWRSVVASVRARLRQVVSVLVSVVDDGRHDLAVSGTVASQFGR